MRMLTKIEVPKTNKAIYAHNSREELAAGVFVSNMQMCAEAATEGYEWALEVIRMGCVASKVDEMFGQAAIFYHMGMTEGLITSVEIANAVRELYEEMKEVKENEVQDEGADTADTNIGQ